MTILLTTRPDAWSSRDPWEDLYIIVAASVMELGRRDIVKDVLHALRLCSAGRAGCAGFPLDKLQ